MKRDTYRHHSMFSIKSPICNNLRIKHFTIIKYLCYKTRCSLIIHFRIYHHDCSNANGSYIAILSFVCSFGYYTFIISRIKVHKTIKYIIIKTNNLCFARLNNISNYISRRTSSTEKCVDLALLKCFFFICKRKIYSINIIYRHARC